MTHHFLVDVVILLAAAVLVVPITKRIGLGSILGYLVAGACLGPFVFNVFSEPKSMLSFAEIGVVLLLFVLGLELNLSRLWQMRAAVFGLGMTQVVLCAGAIALVASAFSDTIPQAVLIGATLALSSTAFAMQMLNESNEDKTEHGQSSFAILLFQDLAAIPLLAAVPLLSASGGQFDPMKALMAFGSIVAVVVGGRRLLRPVFHWTAQVRIKEVFTAATLLLVVGVGVLMESVGLSMALGSFLAGVVLADSEYRHELEADIEPFKGLFLGLFFMAVGMSVHLPLLIEKPHWVLAISIGFMALKLAAIFISARLFRLSSETSRNTSFAIIQGGEFGFVIFGSAGALGILPKEQVDLLVLAITVSMALTPVLWLVNTRLLRRAVLNDKEYDRVFDERQPRVIIAGFGRVGQIIARILRVQKIPFAALDHSPDQIELVRRFGNKVYYGDASRLDLLEAAGAAHAEMVVVAIDDLEASLATVDMIQKHFPKARILARARNRQHAFELLERGVEQIFRETFFSSLRMAEVMLLNLGFDDRRAEDILHKFRLHDEEMLRRQFRVRHSQDEMISQSREAVRQLEEVLASDQ